MANSFGFDPVAWSIDGGKHRGELLRVLAYVASGGSEGVVAPGDCKVHQTGSGTSQVTIDAGAILIRNRSSNARNQTYAANGRTPSLLDITPTGSTKRSDLVIVRIEDPQYSPWPKPPAGQEADYQYVKPIVIQNVPATTTSAAQLNLGYSAYALARIDIPANTSTITDAYIKNTRFLAQARSHHVAEPGSPTAEDVMNSTVGRVWPDFHPAVWVPEWATAAAVRVDLGSIGQRGGSTQGVFAVVLNAGSTQLRSQNSGWDEDTPVNGSRRNYFIVAGFNDIRAIAGTTVTVQTEARLQNDPGVDQGYLVTVAGTQMAYTIDFSELTV